ncbi:MAG: hypothetical protein ACI8XC_003245 [Gammaproteobacteria bacterium]|jgi:hypothetical protein
MSKPLLKRTSRIVAAGIFAMFIASCGTTDDDDTETDPGSSVGNGGSGSDPVAVDTILPVDFEGSSESYAFSDFEGGSLVVVANPSPGGINTSDRVAQMVKDGGAVFGGSKLTLDSVISFSSGELFTAKVWSPRAVPVLLKFEGSAANAEISAVHDGGSSWVELTFDFTGMTSGLGDVVDVVLIFDNGLVGNATNDPSAWTFYIDDIAQGISSGGGGTTTTSTLAMPLSFEDPPGSYTFGDFEGGSIVVIDNPGAAGINTSAQVAQMVKDGGAVFGGSTITLGSAIDSGAGQMFKMKVWASRSVPVLLKFEGSSGNAELTATHSGSSSWEELSFDFTGTFAGLGTVFRVVLIFDNGIVGDAANDPDTWIFYLDDLVQEMGVVAVADIPTDAPTAPAADPANVLSVFSDTYTNVAGVDYNPNWGQSTVVTQESIAGNNVLKLANLSFQGIDFITNGAAQDVSGFTTLHFDYWTDDSTAFNVFLISTGSETQSPVNPPVTGSWQSVDVPLTTFTAVNLLDVIQMKFDGNGTIFFDNIYFY